MTRIKLFATFTLLLASATIGYALPTDSQQPINVQADSADLDNNKGILVYRGNVIITQGSMKVLGHTVTITRNKDGEIEMMTSQGNPAYYEQKPSADDPVVKSYARTIQYQVTKKLVILIDNAKVVQNNNVFTGDKIVYDTSRKLISAGNKRSGSVGTKPGRINVVLEPEKKKGTK